MTDPGRGLSPTELDAWVMLVAYSETIPPLIDAQLKSQLGVNLFEYTVMAMLSEEPDRTLQMATLAVASFGSISRLSHAVTRLEKRGWLEKQAGEGSRRHNVVRLTDQGFAALADAAPRHLDEVRRLIMDPLTDTEVRTLAKILRKSIGAGDPQLLATLEEQVPRIIQHNSAAQP